jgi:hypothetical protein
MRKNLVPTQNGTNPDEPRPGMGSSVPQTSSQSSPLYVVEGSVDEPEGEPEEPADQNGDWFQ